MENSLSISVLICGFTPKYAWRVGGNSEDIETVVSEAQHQVKEIYVKVNWAPPQGLRSLKTHMPCHQESQLICSSFLITDFSFF